MAILSRVWRIAALAIVSSLCGFSAPSLAEPATATEAAAPATPRSPDEAKGATEITTEAKAPAEPERLGAVVRRLIDARAATLAEADRADAMALKAYIEARQDEPLWTADGKLTSKAEALVREIGRAEDWGLDPKDFKLPPQETLRAEEAEIVLSLAALKYARFARGGRIEDPAKQLASYLDRMPQTIEPKLVLEQIAASSDVEATLRGFHPKHPQFEKLRQKYLELSKASAAAEAVVKLPSGPLLKPGQKHPDVALLRKRLKVPVPAGKDGAPGDDTLFDEGLVQAVKAYQTEKALTPDGLVGPAVRRSLNDVDAPSPQKLLANMEQWRWMPEDLGSYHIWVNIPEFMIRVVKDGKIVHEERVITGLTDKQTPVFSDEMELVTFHPSWNVPESIKVKELYPSLARGGTYFSKQGLRLSKNGQRIDPDSVDWSSADIRKFDVQQPPGTSNVLGVVKFSFPNKHTVYMHDTPTKNLFEEASRPFSHGCMRVRNPMRLAEIVLEGDKGWDAAKVQSMAQGSPVENPITLDKKIPVHITYFTSWIADDGTEQRFKDVYGHEQRISLALAGRFNEIAKLPDHLAPVSYPKTQYAGNNPFETFLNNVFGGF